VDDVGRLDPAKPGHHNRTSLFPEGYTVSRQAPMGTQPDPAEASCHGVLISSVVRGADGPSFVVHLVPPGVCACVCMCVRACLRVCVHVCVCLCVHVH
jgi:hypothetical protein